MTNIDYTFNIRTLIHTDETPEVKTVKYNGTIEEWMAEQTAKSEGQQEGQQEAVQEQTPG
jgi:hypothetical protein